MSKSNDELRILMDAVGEKPIAFHRKYAEITGSITAGLLLAQLYYWSRTMKHNEFYKTDKDISSEIGMTLHETHAAKKKLIKLGLITIEKKGCPCKTYYKLAVDKLINWLMKKSDTEVEKIGSQYMKKSDTITETTSETTSETKTNRIRNNSLSCFLSSFSDKEQVEIKDIFDYWNSYKGENRWHSHNKLTPDIIQAIMNNLKEYLRDEVCIAIENYATVLIGEEYYWDYTWNLYTFLSVTDRKKVGHPKKWLQFHSNNFVESSYLRFEQKKDPIITLIEDPDPELTKEIIQKYCRLINTTPSDFTVTPEHKNKFIQATIKMTEYFSRGKGRIMKAVWVDYLMECMQDIRVNKGEVVYPGNLCSKHTWEELMPQQLKGLGIWAR